ncbi:ATP-binding protein [Thermomicrobium sp. 4228-Ro]|uniref:sensor histidine kinase n=1 Tax=Thermomicrobium sp. 4228-Ro TaxID=2993937 RepID=UPI002248FE43|nr:ATP-binding protein [Thermomicrobium sp. 4228-Ro]MCX2727154.1 ATP-binding protein [Thermomicrobium sp. 4228-Ro]
MTAWHPLRTAPHRLLTGRLSRTLLVSHLAVAFLTLVLVVVTYVVIAVLTRGDELLNTGITYDPDFANGTRLIAQLLPPHVERARDDPGALDETLRSLRSTAIPGSGPLGGTVNEQTGITVVAPDGTVLATTLESVRSLEQLEPLEWREAFRAALAGTRDLSREGPLVRRAEQGTMLVSAYPIVAPDGTLLGAVGLRTQPVGHPPPTLAGHLASLALGLGLVVGDFLLTAAIPAAIVSFVASFLLTRRMRSQLQELEAATDAIVRGELGRRVAVLSGDELGRLAARFNLLAGALERLEQQRRAFFANVAHDLRTPLALIRVRADNLIERVARERPDLQEELEQIAQETETLSRLIEDLFTLARLDERGLPLHLAPVDLATIFTAIVESVRPLAWRAGRIVVTSEVSPDCPPVHADALRLRQVLMNLVHNALRHTPEGGVIHLRTAHAGSTVIVQVCDTGAGFPAELLEEPFGRYRSTSDPQSGSGLGLAVARQLVEAQGGTIWIESQAGQGTTVSFTLPVAQPDSTAQQGDGELTPRAST